MKQHYTFKKLLFGSLILSGVSLLSSGAFAQLYPFSSHTFTNAGAEGKDGPTITDCVTEYTGAGAAWASDPAFFNMSTQGIQEWTVPATGDYEIEVGGAQGGYHAYTSDPEDGGLGAIVTGTFALTEGQILYILVGQEGEASQEGSSFSEDNAAPGGGGGSFVWDPTDDALPMMAAGGGGAGASPGGYALKDATVSEDANPTQGLANAGLGGNGGRPNNGSCSWWAGAGAGWLTNGTGGNNATAYTYTPGSSGAEGGRSPLSGGFGGIRWNDGSDEGGDGGFGGGGGGGSDNMNGGGGGGFSGGGGGRGCEISPGGGGSYNSGIDQTNIVANTGMGYVTITLLCNPLTTDIPVTGVCIGEELTLEATSVTGGTVTWDGGVSNGVPFAPPLGTTTYSASSTSADDCPFSIDISASEVPDITANSSLPSACEGALITLWGEGGDTYEWSGTGAVTPEDSVAFYAEEGTNTYTVVGSILGCEGPPASITLEAAPQPEVVGNTTAETICQGESFVLTGSGASTYYWGGGISDGDEITPATAGTFIYTVVGESADGCTDTSNVMVTVNPTPMVLAGMDFTVCEDDDVTLSGSGALTYSWDMGVTDGVAFPALAGETTYTVTGTDINGCTDTDEIVVTGVERPTVTDAVITPEYFGYDGEIDITVEGGSGAYTFIWSHGPTTEDVVGLTEGTYTVTIDDIITEKGLCPTVETFTVSSFVGIDEAEVFFSAYPNPTTDQLTIVYEGTFDYQVTTVSGQVVMNGTSTDQEQVSLANLAEGTYIIKVFADNKVSHLQVVKQ